MRTTSNHYSLNPKQIRILKLVFKFRYITVPLLVEYKDAKSLASLREGLRLLVDQEYLSRRYGSSYKLQGIAARYYLAPKALTYLRVAHGFNETVLHAMYRNKTVSENFIDHNLDVFRVYINLSTGYPHTFDIYTKQELTSFEQLPSPLPDLYLRRTVASDTQSNHYLLDISRDVQFFVLKKRFDQYLEHYESGNWEASSNDNYPTVLIVCLDSRLEKKLNAYVEKVLSSTGIDDLFVYITTLKALLDSGSSNQAIWTKVTGSGEISTLVTL